MIILMDKSHFGSQTQNILLNVLVFPFCFLNQQNSNVASYTGIMKLLKANKEQQSEHTDFD